MSGEPAVEQLILFVRKRLDAISMDKIQSHLDAGCGACESQLEWIRSLLLVTTRDSSEDLPDAIRAAGHRIFSDHQRRRTETDPRVTHGILMFDSAWVPLPAAARAPASGQRRLLFSAEPFEVDLEISRIRRGSYDLLGQLLPSDHIPSLAQVTLLQRRRRTVSLDARGLFSFEVVAAGTVGLSFRLVDKTIKLSGVRVG